MDGYYPPAPMSPQELQRQLSQQHHQQQQQQQTQQQQAHQQHQQKQAQHHQQQQHHHQQQQHHAQQAQVHQAQAQAHAQAHAQAQARAQSNTMAMSGGQQQGQQRSSMSHYTPDQPMMGGDSLDDIIRDNQSELHRRRSMPQSYSNAMAQENARRMSAMNPNPNEMMTFGGSDHDLGSYQFSQDMSSGFPAMTTPVNLGMNDQMANYMDNPSDYANVSPDAMTNMMPNFASMNVGQMGGNASGMNFFAPQNPNNIANQFSPNGMESIGNGFSMDVTSDGGPLSATPSNAPGGMGGSSNEHDDGGMMNQSQQYTPSENTPNGQGNDGMKLDPGMGDYNASSLSRHVSSSGSGVSPQQQGNSVSSMTHHSASSGPTTPATGSAQRESKDKTIYSKSGFDMLKALWLVATRKDPKINLGAVDMSCAFVVCDVNLNDCPIIYVSDNFQNLTGYSRHEIVGQNCRFLQAPDGHVESGSKREFVDDGAVYNLKKMVHERREVQQSLINYRKGGKPFLNLLTMIPIPWDTEEIRYFIGFQIDLVECPDAIAAGQEMGGVKVNYKHSDIGQYIWTPPASSQWEPENGQSLGVDDVSTLLQQFSPKGLVSDWHKQSWDKMLLENSDDVVHVLSLKGLFLYLSPSCKRILEYDSTELVGNSLSSVCHPSDIVPVTRELKDTTADKQVDFVFRIRRKNSGYTWFESHGSLFVEQGKGRKCIILVGRKRPVYTLSRNTLESYGGIGDSELWTKLSTSGMFLYVSSNIRSLLDLQPEALVGTSIQELMRKESRPEFGRAVERARRGKTVSCKHEVQNRRGQVLQAQTVLYPGDAGEGQKPTFLLAQTKLLKASSRSLAPASGAASVRSGGAASQNDKRSQSEQGNGQISQPAGGALGLGTQDAALASDDNIFDELRTTKCSSWQFELRQMEKVNRILAEELGGLLSNKKKRKRRKGVGNVVRDCANCHTRNTPEWRRGPSGQRDLCNSCGLRWAKQTGRVSPRNSSRGGRDGNGDANSKKSASPIHSSPLHKEMSAETPNPHAANRNGDGGVNPAQLTNPNAQQNAVGGNASAVGQKSMSMMPPPSQPTLPGGAAGAGMTSIREERESSQP